MAAPTDGPRPKIRPRHLSGAAHGASAMGARRHTIPRRERWRVDDRIAPPGSDLARSRSGGAAIAELASAGRRVLGRDALPDLRYGPATTRNTIGIARGVQRVGGAG